MMSESLGDEKKKVNDGCTENEIEQEQERKRIANILIEYRRTTKEMFIVFEIIKELAGVAVDPPDVLNDKERRAIILLCSLVLNIDSTEKKHVELKHQCDAVSKIFNT